MKNKKKRNTLNLRDPLLHNFLFLASQLRITQ